MKYNLGCRKDLKPCPFCGGQFVLIDVDFTMGKIHNYYKPHIYCDDCSAEFSNEDVYGLEGLPDTIEKCVQGWNRRS